VALPLRLRTRLGEPAHGTLKRLASRHRETCPRAFGRSIGVAFNDLLVGRGHGRIASLAGVCEVSLARWTPQLDVISRTVKLGDDELLLNDWSSRKRRWCSDCFRDDRHDHCVRGQAVEFSPWHRAIWDVGSVRTCSKHALELSAACWRCERPQDWLAPALDRCACGADLASPQVRRSEEAVSPASDYIAGRLGQGDFAPISLLDNLKLKDAISVLEKLGHAQISGMNFHRGRATPEEVHRARDVGVEVALGWPNSMSAILTAVAKKRRATTGKKGIMAAYGWVYSGWAASKLPSPFDLELRQVLRDHAIAHEIIENGERLFGEPAYPDFNLTQAAKALGMSYDSGKRLLAERGLIGPALRRGVAAAVDRHVVLEISQQLSFKLDLQDVSGILGIGKSQTRAIVSQICLRDVGEQDNAPEITADVLRNFMQQIRHCCCVPDRTAGNQIGVALPKACQKMGVPIHVAVKAILGRRLKPTGFDRGARGLSQVLLELESLRPYRTRIEEFTAEAASQLIGLHPEAVRALVRRGYIPTRTCTGKIAYAGVINFKERYVASAEIAAKLGVSSHRARVLMKAKGVPEIIGPPICRAIIFNRADVDNCLLELALSNDRP
jgi:hypothetical protein